MNDYDVMHRYRLKWCRELGHDGHSPMPDKRALEAYQRGFMDALNVALGRVIEEQRAGDREGS